MHDGDHADGGHPGLADRHEHLLAAMARAREQGRHLQDRIAALGREVARSEEGVADILEDSVLVRPHAAERLTAMAREAREFAARERAQDDGDGAVPPPP